MFVFFFSHCGAAVGAVLRWLLGFGACVFCAFFFYRYIGGNWLGAFFADRRIGRTLN